MKLFTGADLIIYFFIYGILAWVINTAVYSLKEQKYVSTGVLNIPILGVPAILMTTMIIVSSGKNVSYYGMLLMAFTDYLILEKFMFFWGIVALIWFRFVYPPLSKTIEKIPPVTGTVLAVIITVFFICNGIVTSMVMIRTTDS